MTSSKQDEPIDVYVEFIRKTKMAIQVTDGDLKVWVPIKLITDGVEELEEFGEGSIDVPSWFAEREGLV